MYIFLYIIVGIVLFILLISFIVYMLTFYNNLKYSKSSKDVMKGEQYDKYHDYMKELLDKANKVPYEEVLIKSYDNKTLVGRYYHVNDNATTQIMFHGYKSFATRDFSGGINLSISNGYNTLVVYQRAHGKSSGRTITFGIKERYDVISWCNYINNRFHSNNPIILVGISMGASTVLLANSLKLPSNVKGIIADCPYNSVTGIIKKVVEKDLHLSYNLFKPFIYIASRIFARFNINEIDSFKALKDCNIPILLIHGDDDRFVPCDMSIDLYNTYPNIIQLELFKDTGHGLSYIVDTNRYTSITKEFIDKVTKMNA